MNLSSKSVFASPDFPGVKVTVKKFSVSRRAKVEFQLAEFREKRKDLICQMVDARINETVKDDAGNVVDPGDPPEVRTEKLKKQGAFRIDFESIENMYLKPAILRVYVSKVEGLESADPPIVTADDLVDEGDGNLGDAVYEYIQRNNGLTPGESSPSGQCGTSEPPEGTETPTTTVTTAENPAS